MSYYSLKKISYVSVLVFVLAILLFANSIAVGEEHKKNKDKPMFEKYLSPSETDENISIAGGDSYEPNGDLFQTYPIAIGTTYNSYIWDPFDLDVYNINLVAGQNIVISLTSLPADFDILFLGPSPDFPILGLSENLGTASDYINYSVGSTGNYYILVGSGSGTEFSTTDSYGLSVEIVPTAFIDSISPNPAIQGQSVTFNGHGVDGNGIINGHNWRSSIDGQLSSSATVSKANLSPGTHTIYYKVQDNAGVWSSEVSAQLIVNIIGPTGAWNSGGANSWSWDASKIEKGDFDGDGIDDIVALYGYETQREVKAFFFKGNSQGGFSSPVVWWSSGPGNWDWAGSMLTSGDFNEDGKWDLAILYGYSVQRDVRTFVFLSDGSKFKSPTTWFHAGPNNWDWAGSILRSGDFDGDGKTDLVILYGYATQRDVVAFVFPSTGNSFSASELWWQAGAGNWDWSGSKVLSGDFTDDGKDDLAIFYGYGGSQSVIFVTPSTGTRFSSPAIWYNSGPGNWGWASTKVLSGNFDGLGPDDIVGFYNYGNSYSALFTFK